MWSPDVIADPRLLLDDAGTYLTGDPATGAPAQYRLVARTVVAELALAGLVAYGMYRLGPRHWREGTSTPHDALFIALRRTAPEGSVPYVRLLTDEEITYEGLVTAYDTTGDLGERSIALSKPIRRHSAGGTTQIGAPWERIVLPLSRVTEMHIAYAFENEPKPSA